MGEEVVHESLAAALAAAQAEMPALEKDSENPHFKSKFVSLDNLIASTRPVLNRHGLSISQLPSGTTLAPSLTTVLRHACGEEQVGEMPLLVAKLDMQALGSAITYGRRYSWASILGIAAEDDDDHQAESSRGSGDQQQTRQRQQTSAVEAAKGWGELTDRLVNLGVPADDQAEWFTQTKVAKTIDTATAEGKQALFDGANRVLAAVTRHGDVSFEKDPRVTLQGVFAAAFGMAGGPPGPPWRVGPSENDRPSKEDYVVAQVKELGVAAGDENIPFGEPAAGG